METLRIEEEWDCLVQNYMELEMELLQSALQSMILSHESYETIQEARLRFTRRLSNLLHTCRSYLDHTPHHLNSLEAELTKSFNQARNNAYDEQFSYRFMEALRNYSQHTGLPMHGTTFHSSWIDGIKPDGEDPGFLRHAVTANVDINLIKKDPKFKSSIRDELEAIGAEKLDVATLTREYIEALGEVHNKLRAQLKPKLTQWKSTIRSAIERFAEQNGGIVTALHIAEFSEDDAHVRSISIFESPLKRSEYLTKRNGSLINLRRRYVSNEIITTKKKTAS